MKKIKKIKIKGDEDDVVYLDDTEMVDFFEREEIKGDVRVRFVVHQRRLREVKRIVEGLSL